MKSIHRTSPFPLEPRWQFPHCPAAGAKLDWEALQDYEWVRTMKGVPQSPVHHAEGNVWIHTQMVAQALLDTAEWQALGDVERQVLFAAALMHDIAKPACTRTESDGRIVSPRHALKGRTQARNLLYSGLHGAVPFGCRETIAHLVRHHGLPLWFLEKSAPRAAVLQAAELVSMPLLALLAEVDVRGRICADQGELLDRVALFREYCKEQQVWEGPFPFPNGDAVHAYFAKPENGPQYVPWDDTRSEVIMMCGLPGAGKDSWIATEGPDWPVLSLDELRIEMGIAAGKNQGRFLAEARERAKVFLRKRQSFIFNATNIVSDIRKQWLDIFFDYKAKVHIQYVEVPYTQLFQQNAARASAVPEAVIHNMIGKWELPEPWEAHSVTYNVKA